MTRIVFDLTKNVRLGQGRTLSKSRSEVPRSEEISYLIENIVDCCINLGRRPPWHDNCKEKAGNCFKTWDYPIMNKDACR